MKKFKILCLHGFGQNATIFKKKIAVLRKELEPIADLIFMSAPFIVELHPNGTSLVDLTRSKELMELDPEAINYNLSWWKANSDGTRYDGLVDTLQFIQQFNVSHGPFDGLLGFSQGACLAALVLHALKNIKFILVAGGFKSRAIETNEFFHEQFDIHSFHVIGESDERIPKSKSEELANCFIKDKRVMYYHAGGHVLPLDRKTRQDIKEWVELLRQQFLTPNI